MAKSQNLTGRSWDPMGKSQNLTGKILGSNRKIPEPDTKSQNLTGRSWDPTGKSQNLMRKILGPNGKILCQTGKIPKSERKILGSNWKIPKSHGKILKSDRKIPVSNRKIPAATSQGGWEAPGRSLGWGREVLEFQDSRENRGVWRGGVVTSQENRNYSQGCGFHGSFLESEFSLLLGVSRCDPTFYSWGLRLEKREYQ